MTKVPDLPRFVVYSSRWTSSSEFRFARDDQHVRRILRGLLSRYGDDLEAAVFVAGEGFDVSSRFIFPKETNS
ncbi:hypothetical protein ACWD4V_16290 [Streptomyces tsukubensis]|uniref:hypothetical protein n=1 Tax=Streptomyces tsukubensis TaxID=83656 RepID=UPI0036AB679D